MKQRHLLSLTSMQLEAAYAKAFPELKQIAEAATDTESFREAFARWLATMAHSEARVLFEGLLEHEGTIINEWSHEEPMVLRTLDHLRRFLRHEADPESGNDLFIDLLVQLRRLTGRVYTPPPGKTIRQHIDRWQSGLDDTVIRIRDENRERILHLLVEKVERGHNSRFRFPEWMTYEEKYCQVKTWWDDDRFQLSMALRSPKEINLFLRDSLSSEMMFLLRSARKKGIPFFVTPYYLSLLDPLGRIDDSAIRSYIFYSPELVKSFGSIRAWEREDSVMEGRPNAAGWIVPD